MNDSSNEYINDDTHKPQMEEDSKSTAKKKLLILLLVGTVIVSFFLWNFLHDLRFRKKVIPPKKIETVIKEKEFKIEKPKKELPQFTPEMSNLPLLPPPNNKPVAVKKVYRPLVIKSSGTSIIEFNDVGTNSNSIAQTQNQTTQTTTTTSNSSSNTNEIDAIATYRGGAYSVAGAHHLDPNLYLPRGTYISCVLKTKLVSMVAGQIACMVSNNVYSANGNVLLIEKGSEVIGSYKTGTMNDGMNRHFVIWEDIRTPKNVIINVSSGASDELGSAGIHGEVDHHWGTRLGVALMFSFIDDTIGALTQAINGNDRIYYTPDTSTDATTTITANLVKQFSSIKPTLYKNQGSVVGIFVNRDVDFSKVYRLKRKSSY